MGKVYEMTISRRWIKDRVGTNKDKYQGGSFKHNHINSIKVNHLIATQLKG